MVNDYILPLLINKIEINKNRSVVSILKNKITVNK